MIRRGDSLSTTTQRGLFFPRDPQHVYLALNAVLGILLAALAVRAALTGVDAWSVGFGTLLALAWALVNRLGRAGPPPGAASVAVDVTWANESPTLRESEKRYRTIIERNADGIVIVDRDGVVRYVNPAAEALFNRAAPALVGEVFGFPVVNGIAEIEVIRSSGERPVWAEMRVVDVVQQGEQVFIASLRDITDRKQTGRDLEQRNQTLHLLHDFTTEITSELKEAAVVRRVVEQAVSLLHADGGLLFTYNSDEMALRLAHSHAALPGSVEIIIEQRSDLIGDMFAARTSHIDSIRLGPGDALGVHHDSEADADAATPSALTLLITPLVWHSRPVAALVVFRAMPPAAPFVQSDVTIGELFAAQSIVALKNAELHKSVRDYALNLEREVLRQTAEIRSQRERLEAILNNINNAVILTDLSAQITYYNRALTAMLDHPDNGALTLAMIAPELDQQVRAQIAEQTVWNGEIIVTHCDGALCDMDVVIVPVFNVEGVIESIVVSLRDVTHLRQLDRMKTSFMHHISHELRTPLSNIMMSTYLLRSSKSERILNRHIEVLDNQARRLKGLTEKVLDAVRLADTDAAATRDVVSLVDIVSQIAVRFEAIAAARQVALHYRAPENGAWQVYGHAHWLTRALSELVENAINYTDAGGDVTLSLDRAPETDAGPCCSVIIDDTGRGIDAEEIQIITEDLYRGRAFLSGTLPGLGLGLTIARTVIAQHQGWLRVVSKSQPARGSTFTVMLPQVDASHGAPHGGAPNGGMTAL